jgi:hypothetical protein
MPAAVLPYHSISISLSGISIFLPSSLSFKTPSTKVLCLLVGETRITSGKQSSETMLLSDIDSPMSDQLSANKALLASMNVSHKVNTDNEEHQRYEISVDDVNIVLLNSLDLFTSTDVPLADQDLEMYRILNNVSLVCKMYKGIVLWSIGVASIEVRKERLDSLVTFSQRFIISQQKIMDVLDEWKRTEKEAERKEEIRREEERRDEERRELENKEQYELGDDSEGEDDEEFFDALDEEDQTIYSMMKNTSGLISRNRSRVESQEISQDQKESLAQKLEEADVDQMLLLIVNLKSFSFSVTESKDQGFPLSNDRSIEQMYNTNWIFRIQLQLIDFGISQNYDSNSMSIIIHNFNLQHRGDEILYTVVSSLPHQSSGSNLLSDGLYDIEDEDLWTPSNHQTKKNALSLTFIDYKNRIIEAKSILKSEISMIKFNIGYKVVKDLVSLYPKKLSNYSQSSKQMMSKPALVQDTSSKRIRLPQIKNLSGMANSLEPEVNSVRFRSQSYFKEESKRQNLTDGESSCKLCHFNYL